MKGPILIAALLGACQQSLTGTGPLPGGPHGASGRGGSGGWSTSPTGAGGVSVSGTGSSGSWTTTGTGAITGTGATEGWSITDAGIVGGAGGAPSCAALVSLYDATITDAQLCSVAGSGQCQQPVLAHLSPCGACPTYVNNAKNLAEIQMQWQRTGCDQRADAGVCAQAPCPTPTNNTCADVGDGTARCSFVPSAPRDARGTPDASVSDCEDLGRQYLAALPAAKRCSAAGQCAHSVPSYLSPCGACPTYVNDTTTLNAIQNQWDQDNCDGKISEECIDLCVQPMGLACTPTDGGEGVCTAT